MIGSSLVRPAVGSLLAVLAFATITLVDSSPETYQGGSQKPLSLCSALLLALRRYRITSKFLVNKLYTKGYLPFLTEQVTQTFDVLVN
jgi:hypothetical protein